MKVLIWLACILVYSALQVVIRSQGIVLGGVPTALLALLLVFIPAPALCKLWEKRKKLPPAIPHDERKERWYTCQKCGQLVREGEDCDCEQVAPAQEEQPDVAEKKGGWRRILPYISCLLLAVFFVISLLAAIRSNREPEICVRCSSEGELTASCPCCSAPICQSCLADIEYEHSKSEAEENADAAPSFSEWTTAPYSMPRWQRLYDAGYINLSYEEWQQFTEKMYDGVASEFLREKAREQREKADREYGPTAYGSTCWDLWYKLTDAGHTTAAFDDFAEAYKLNTDE